MRIDGPITSQTIDSSGEILHLKGLDISDFNEGKAVANWEHDNSHPDNIIGHFVSVHKIFSRADCKNDRQRLFWDQLKTPFLYGVCELFDDEEHPGAVAVAAMLRYFKKKSEKVIVGFSIEGSTLERKGNDLKQTVGRRVAVTLKPCNRQCLVDVMGDKEADRIMNKSEKDFSQMVTVDSAILDDIESVKDLTALEEDLRKTLTVGIGNAAPGTLTGGSALSREDLDKKTKTALMVALRDWNRKRPLKEAIKAAMPEVSDDYVDHFTRLAEDMALKKGMKGVKLYRIGNEHSNNEHADEHQKKLVNGLYINFDKQFVPRDDSNYSNILYRVQNDAGQQVMAKPPSSYGPTLHTESVARNASNYYHLARDFFGMKDHVPVTNHFVHPLTDEELPETGLGDQPWVAMEYVAGAKSPLGMGRDEYNKRLGKARENGSAHKLFLTDLISGMADRHLGNVMIDKSGKFHHIDNDHAFTYGNKKPFYLSGGDDLGMVGSGGFDSIDSDTLHVDAQKWLKKLHPEKLVQMMHKFGLSPRESREAARRLLVAQKMGASGATLNQIWDAIHKPQEDEREKRVAAFKAKQKKAQNG